MNSRVLTASEIQEYNILPCPWCNKHCMYVEFDTPPTRNPRHDSSELVRIGSICDEADEAEEVYGDSIGNDWGRSNWQDTLEEAVKDWVSAVTAGKDTNQQGVW